VFSRGVSSAGVSIAVLLYLGSIGLVGGVTTGLLFGSGLLLLGQPSEQIDAKSRVHDRNTEVSPLRPGGSSANAEKRDTLRRRFPGAELDDKWRGAYRPGANRWSGRGGIELEGHIDSAATRRRK
jgi:hypothetical protein